MSETLRVKAIELVDDAGNPRGFLGIDEANHVGLVLRDSKGTARIGLGFTDKEEEASLALRDSEGRDVVVAFVDREGAGSVLLNDNRGVRRIVLQIDSEGGVHMGFYVSETKAPLMFKLDRDGIYEGSFDDPVCFEKPKMTLVYSEKKNR